MGGGSGRPRKKAKGKRKAAKKSTLSKIASMLGVKKAKRAKKRK